ncbi:MAG: MarR family winged helix-turn-helix transcriptional regulator [Rhodospirillales bacterium]
MTDVLAKFALPPSTAAGSADLRQPLDIDEQRLRRAIELLFFAYRDFTGEADGLLVRYGFGRAHHRVIYFVGRHPGIGVGELLAILKITKQSLARVLGQLIDGGFVVQRSDRADGRRRRLYLTPEAEALERTLTARQAALIAAAFEAAGPEAAQGFAAVLRALVGPADRHRFDPP